jgi:hypothetical protein
MDVCRKVERYANIYVILSLKIGSVFAQFTEMDVCHPVPSKLYL